ncbi:unnamed protein product, partial [Laminaria digitata]
AWLLTCLCSCTTVRSVHLSNLSVPKESGRPISAKVSKVLVLGIGFSNDLAGAAMKGLFDQCAGGRVMFVHSRLSTSHYIIMQRTTVHVSGRC